MIDLRSLGCCVRLIWTDVRAGCENGEDGEWGVTEDGIIMRGPASKAELLS